jgi:L-fuconolactonase
MIIDAHHHFWNYTPAEYGWIDDAMAVIRRDFLPADLERAIKDAGVDGVVTVQARQTIEETEWLLDLAEKHDFIRGVVGWVPLISRDIGAHLERFAANKKLKGVRHVLQGEPDEYMSRSDFHNGIYRLRKYGLVYDLLIVERQLPAAIRFRNTFAGQPFVVDHIAKPRIREGVLSPWRENLIELGREQNIYCKLSGMVTEADYHAWTPAQLRPYFETALEAFGPRRLMFGSDWPVCLVACGYRRWLDVMRDFLAELSPTEQSDILGGTAARAYALS